MTPQQEQAVRELREAVKCLKGDYGFGNTKVEAVTSLLSQTQAALEQAQREREEANERHKEGCLVQDRLRAKIIELETERDDMRGRWIKLREERDELRGRKP